MVVLERNDYDVERYLENLLAANDLDDLDSWMQIISTAEFAAASNDPKTAESLYKLALQFAEQRMSTEVVINALLCLSTLYKNESRILEGQTAYARAIALFEGLAEK